MKSKKTDITILVIDNHEIIRIGLRSLLEHDHSLHIIAETDSVENSFQIISNNPPNIILMELQLNDISYQDYLPKLLTLSPQSKIIAFTAINERQTHLHALQLGAKGVVTKCQHSGFLLKAIHAVCNGRLWLNTTSITPQILQTSNALLTQEVLSTPQYSLTKRECHIACLASKGLTAKKIGEELGISEKTVRNQITVVYEKLNVTGKPDLCVKADGLKFCNLPEHTRDWTKCNSPKKT